MTTSKVKDKDSNRFAIYFLGMMLLIFGAMSARENVLLSMVMMLSGVGLMAIGLYKPILKMQEFKREVYERNRRMNEKEE
jgi:4-hydroxybenzoate polyprenyltransferase